MSASARLDLRLTPQDKRRVEAAANLRGLQVASFVRAAVLREADQAMSGEHLAHLAPAEARRFVKALSRAFKPNAALRKALARGDKFGL
jgi:uncharacterized protein (DUF1778 family)